MINYPIFDWDKILLEEPLEDEDSEDDDYCLLECGNGDDGGDLIN